MGQLQPVGHMFNSFTLDYYTQLYTDVHVCTHTHFSFNVHSRLVLHKDK